MDIKETRIDEPLKEISETMLCDLPEKEPWTIAEFVNKTKVYRITDSVKLVSVSYTRELL